MTRYKVRVLNGGLEQEVRRYDATTFECTLRPSMFVGKEEVLTGTADDAVCTVNTLTPEVYEDAHITGSFLLPCSDLMHDMAVFLPTDKLVARLAKEAGYERIVTYCGGGIAATINAMAHLMGRVGQKRIADQ